VHDTVRVGSFCRELFSTVHKMLDGYHGWKFMHHLGHGIGLSAHETPRINPNWDDTFMAGDVFTIEPGLYGDDLNAGMRIEDNFLLTPVGLEQLSTFPRSL
jgi:Xaa-Pro dipeptidase